MWEYTDKVHDHFLNPRNVGSLKDANAIGEVGSLACGDALKLYLKINNNDIIEDAKFQTFGCASAIASSSALTELVKGKAIDEALKITNREIAEYLGGLPKEKMHCSVMGQEALEAAIRNYRGLEPLPEEEGEMICKCFHVTDQTIKRAIKENNIQTLEDIIHYTKAGGACTKCHDDLRAILDECLARDQIVGKEHLPKGQIITAGSPVKNTKALSNLQRMQLVMKVIDESIRPRLKQDGGDLELVDIDGKTVYVALLGMCKSCASGQQTLKNFIEKTLREKVEDDLSVKEA